jgi:hypothetical protein
MKIELTHIPEARAQLHIHPGTNAAYAYTPTRVVPPGLRTLPTSSSGSSRAAGALSRRGREIVLGVLFS